MRKIKLHIILILIPIFSFGQTDSEINRLIDSLKTMTINCESFHHSDLIKFQDKSILKLIEIGEPATKQLLESIDNVEKTVIIHMILTNILEPEKSNDLIPLYIFKNCDDLIGAHFIFNGLIWESYCDTNHVLLKNSEIVKVKKYWTKRIYENIDTWKNNNEEIRNKLVEIDSVKYPCSKFYENNTSNIDINRLLALLETKFPSDRLNEIFNILGNDSINEENIGYYKKLYINYESDGISFEFDSTNNLKAMYFRPTYKSELIGGIKMSDTKDDVLFKLGTPDKVGWDWIWYEKKNIEVAFDRDNYIKWIVIRKKFDESRYYE